MNSRSIFSKLLLASALALSLAAPQARAQDAAPAKEKDEAAPTSIAAGIALPEAAPKARRVTDKVVVDALSSQLKKMAAGAGIPLGAPEVLTWSGEGYKRENVKVLTEQVTAALKDDGFEYRPLGKPLPAEGSTTTVFTANNDKKQSMLMGYWVEADKMLVLVWAALEAPQADAFPGQLDAPKAPAAPPK